MVKNGKWTRLKSDFVKTSPDCDGDVSNKNELWIENNLILFKVIECIEAALF